MDAKTTISVIMACYNCEKTLAKAIDSILDQTYTDWVMICCDDGSTDHTLDILKQYEAEYPDQIQVLQNERNRKLPYSLNHCLEFVQTDLVARMDADDWSLPERFERQVQFLKEHSDADLVGTGVRVTNGEKIIATIIQPYKPVPKDMLYYNCFSHATIMTYKRVYDALGGYSLLPYVERCEDFDLWSRFFEAGFTGYNIRDELYVVYDDDNAIRRRTWQNRVNAAKTASAAFKRLDLHGFACFEKSYLHILKFFVPMGLYQKLHQWTMNRRSRNSTRR